MPTLYEREDTEMTRLFGDEVIIKAYTRTLTGMSQERRSYRFVVQSYELEDKWQIMRDVLEQIDENEELISIEYAVDEHINYGEYIYSEDDDGYYEELHDEDFFDLTDFADIFEDVEIDEDDYEDFENEEMSCDLTGYCCGPSCPNYFNCTD